MAVSAERRIAVGGENRQILGLHPLRSAVTLELAEWLSQVTFYTDSAENVGRNYAGSYFYRLRG